MTIPNKRLVGINPRLDNEGYSDDYTDALNRFVSVREVFGEHKKSIAKGGREVGRLVMGTLGKSEYEEHLVSLVMRAANAGEWRGIKRGLGRQIGLNSVVKKGFGYVTEFQGEKILLPSALYVVYCDAQLNTA